MNINLLFLLQNVRLKTVAVEFIVNMAAFKEVYNLKMVPHLCLAPLKPSMQAKIALSRLEIVQKLVEKLGLDTNRYVYNVLNNTTVFSPFLVHVSSVCKVLKYESFQSSVFESNQEPRV